MPDPQKIYRQLLDLLPQLGEVLAYDFGRFRTCQRDILVDYARVLDKLLDVLMAPCPAKEEAAKVIEEFIASREKPYGQWKSPDWLAYELSQVIERAKKRQRRKRHRSLANDELPF
jgi:hypothetical protein